MPKYYSNRMGEPTLVLANTSPKDKYYGEFFDAIADFHITLAESVLKRDNVLIVVPEKHSQPYLEHLPADVLLYDKLPDIWMRDFTPVGMKQNVMFRYKPNYMSKADAEYIQGKLYNVIKKTVPASVLPKQCSLVLDGGNVVDNGRDKAVVMDRVLTDNSKLSREHVRQKLQARLGYEKVAFIPDDRSRCGHADGVVSFIDVDTLAVSCGFGGAVDHKMQRAIEDEMFAVFGESVKVVYLNSEFTDESRWRQFDSAAGLHVNLVATEKHLLVDQADVSWVTPMPHCSYVPVFGHDARNVGQSAELDADVLQQIAEHTTKKVLPVEVDNKVCRMGGSVRCLSWQTQGALADELIHRARLDAARVDPDNFEEAQEPV